MLLPWAWFGNISFIIAFWYMNMITWDDNSGNIGQQVFRKLKMATAHVYKQI